MATQQLYILPEDVLLMPVSELAEAVRSNFTYEDNDFVITLSHERNTSKVIDASSALLIKEFRTPRSLPEGVFAYSRINKLNAADVLTEAYPFLVRLRSERFLHLYNESETKIKDTLLTAGDTFEGYEVMTKLPGVNDTEIYKLKKNGSYYALKVLKTNEKNNSLSQHFFNETEVLQRLDGMVNPALTEHGIYKGNHYLITEWIDGISCTAYAEKYRNTSDIGNLIKLLDLGCHILNVYSHLHRQDILHADIHPNNILVEESGKVSLIDFGLAAVSSREKNMTRGGIGFFYEPEYAASAVNNLKLPQASCKGEQYALGALLYLLLTGKQYLNFSYEKEVLFTQILNDSPISFSDMDIYIDPAIEAALQKALAKNPDDRFASVNEFYNSLASVRDSLLQNNLSLPFSFSAFTNHLQEKYGFESPLMEAGLQMAPTSSVNYGAAGIAYLFYRMALVQSNAELLSVADVWANKACHYETQQEKAFYSPELDITSSTVGATSIYHTASGAHLVQALISKEMYDYNTHFRSVLSFIQAASQPCENLDLTLGKSASLTGCTLLYKNILLGNEMIKKELLQFGNSVLHELWTIIDSYEPVGTNSPVAYNGIAHGWAGILYATLAWCKTSEQTLPQRFFERVEQLLSIGIEEENYIRWPLSVSENASWPGWCHGSAGYTFLWTLLYRFTGDEKYLQTAEKTANHFLSVNKEGTLANLCCGKSGEAYALLSLYNVTQNNEYAAAAKQMAKTILPLAYANLMRNHSLYKGDIGVCVLAAEIENSSFARMPLFEL